MFADPGCMPWCGCTRMYLVCSLLMSTWPLKFPKNKPSVWRGIKKDGKGQSRSRLGGGWWEEAGSKRERRVTEC